MRSIILVEPEIPENTGFIARLADNYNAELRIVNPEFQLEKARKTATNAQQKLRNARIYETIEQAIENLDQVIGTKPGKGLPVKQFQPRENTSIMIGRESSGLSNSELEKCDAVVHIDVPGYSSLNQSHATAIIMHQLSDSERNSIGDQQKEILAKHLGNGKLKELVMRGSPTEDEFNRMMGELKDLQ